MRIAVSFSYQSNHPPLSMVAVIIVHILFVVNR
nr:MAG TPA_asm: hypothetical protein [Caudoviricetes sp.]